MLKGLSRLVDTVVRKLQEPPRLRGLGSRREASSDARDVVMGCTASQEEARPLPNLMATRDDSDMPELVANAVQTPPGRNEVLQKQSESHEVASLRDLVSPGRLTDKYEVEDVILGVGQFAEVKPCYNRQTGMKCAVKLIKRSNTSEKRLNLEIEILRRVKGHPNIVGLFDVYATADEVQLVMEFVEGGELFDSLVSNGPYSEAEAVHHMRRIVSAVEYLHRVGVVHRDLKPENLLLTSPDIRLAEVKVADFGLARIYSDRAMQTVCGTWAYAAPEVRNDPFGYGPKVDVWSLGVILFVLLAAYHPFDPNGQETEEGLWRNVEQGRFDFNDEAWRGVSPEARDLIRRMIKVNVKERMTASDVLAHPWITGFRHGKVPLSPRINLDLEAVRARYARQKLHGAGKAVWAHAAFTQFLTNNKKSRDGLGDDAEATETEEEEVKVAIQ